VSASPSQRHKDWKVLQESVRAVRSVTPRDGGWDALLFECGHAGTSRTTAAVKVGDRLYCVECLKEMPRVS